MALRSVRLALHSEKLNFQRHPQVRLQNDIIRYSNRTGHAYQMATKPSKKLETFPNPNPQRDYHIHMEIPEFTCLCPKTGQPDFAMLILDYIADQKCVELKSLKLYIWSFRNEGHFHEDVTNRILDDLAAATRPRFMRLTAKFNVRGGIFTNVVAEHRKPGWQPVPHVELNWFDTRSNTRG
jgi:7-cyano-7-deazaguanine reductase